MRSEKGVTLIKLILIAILVLVVGFCVYSMFSFGEYDDVINEETKDLDERNIIANEIGNLVNQNVVDDGSMDIEITTFADASKYKVGDIVTTGTIAIGFVEIEDIKLKYPIASKVTTDPALAYSPAYLYGPGLNQVGRTTIVGMVNSFEGVDKVKGGSKIKITDDEENTKDYKIIEVKKTTSKDASYAKTNNEKICELAISLVYNNNKDERLVIIAEEIIE